MFWVTQGESCYSVSLSLPINRGAYGSEKGLEDCSPASGYIYTARYSAIKGTCKKR